MTRQRDRVARRAHRRATRPTRAIWWWAGGAVLLAVLVWLVFRPEGVREAGTPISTLTGEPAPILEFPDAAGRPYRVPERGRPTVLVFHMGLH